MTDIVLHPDLTKKQKDILKSKGQFIILRGPAGTSKTYIALARGLKLLKDKVVDRIVIIRSAVEIRKIGFLPGDSDDKLMVYTEPYDVLMKQLSPKKNFKAMISSGQFEFHSTSFLRGVTWDRSYVIVDEYQNMNAHELETVVTRVGLDTHMVLCGDSDQTDLVNGESKEHHSVVSVLESMPEFTVFEFGLDDIVRSEFVRSYYTAKAKLDKFDAPAFLRNKAKT